MPTSVPNLNFLVPLVTEIWWGSKNKKWEFLISPADKFLYRTLARVNAYTSVPNFNFPAPSVSEIKKFNV